jgi:hypothetical protein
MRAEVQKWTAGSKSVTAESAGGNTQQTRRAYLLILTGANLQLKGPVQADRPAVSRGSQGGTSALVLRRRRKPPRRRASAYRRSGLRLFSASRLVFGSRPGRGRRQREGEGRRIRVASACRCRDLFRLRSRAPRTRCRVEPFAGAPARKRTTHGCRRALDPRCVRPPCCQAGPPRRARSGGRALWPTIRHNYRSARIRPAIRPLDRPARSLCTPQDRRRDSPAHRRSGRARSGAAPGAPCPRRDCTSVCAGPGRLSG